MPIDYTKLVNLEDAKVGMSTEHAMIASNYSSSATYAVGAYAYHAGTLYKCTTAITTAEAWNSSHWEEAKLGNDLVAQSEKISEVYKFDVLTKSADSPAAIYPYSFVSGTTYYVRNDGNAFVNARTCTSDGTEVELIKNSIGVGETVVFTATQNASYVRLYASGNASKLSICTNGQVITKVYQEIGNVSDSLDTLANDVGGYIEKFEIESLEITSGSVINSNGVVVSVAGNYSTGEASVTAGDKYLISASSNWSNPLWAWYDSDDNLIAKGTDSAGSSTVTSITDTETTAPTGATKIVINWISSGTTCYLKHSLGQKIAGKWYGKKWVCVGDSLTEINDKTGKHYFDFVADKTDISIVNMGVSGTGYKNAGSVNNPFYTRVLNIPSDADVITIFGSFNDGIQDIGTATDTGTSTIGGCVNTTLDNLYSVIPTARIGIVSPTPWDSANQVDHDWAKTYVDLLEAICQRRSVPFLNLYLESNLRPWDSTFRTLAYSNDSGFGVHPNDLGHAIIAPKFEAFLDMLLLH